MGIISEFTETYGEPRPKCLFCERLADAFWMGDPQIFICYWCATNHVLPKLIGDAICNRAGLTWKDVRGARQDIERELYRAMVIRLCDRIKAMK